MNAQQDAHKASAAGLGRLDFRLLGPLEALIEGKPVPLGPPKQRAVLAHLLLRANDAVPVERLIDALWPEAPPVSARPAIHVYVSGLRRALGTATRIESRSRAYVLRAGPEEIDLVRFRHFVAEAREALAGDDATGAAEGLSEALALWRDRALADLEDEPGVRDLALELEEERMSAIELRIEAELAAGRDAELIPELEHLIVEHPAREELHAQLMLALYRSGRQAEAWEASRQARRLGTQDALLYYHAGMIARSMPGRQKEALTLLQRSLKVNPHWHLLQAREARRALDAIRTARGD